MSKARAKVEGLKELQANFRTLGTKEIERVGYRSTLKGGGIIRDEAKHRVRINDLYQTGAMHEEIAVSRAKPNGTTVGYEVGVRHGRRRGKRDNDPFYWWFQEFGTRFIPARPFLGPAFRSKVEAAAQALKEAAVTGIMKAAAKLGSKR